MTTTTKCEKSGNKKAHRKAPKDANHHRLSHCANCVHANFCVRHKRIRLVHRDSLSPSMWINRHIVECYRPLELPWMLCVKSMFEWNNETLNVWTHLFGFLHFAWLQYKCAWVELPAMGAHPRDYIVVCAAMLCCQLCMLLSTAYHVFGCHSAHRRKRWLRADLTGVSLGLLGLYLSGIYTSFYHFPILQRVYMSAVVTMCGTIAGYTLLRQFTLNDTTDKHSRRIGTLHFLYVGTAVIALWPTWHWIQLHGGLWSAHVQRWLPNLAKLFALIGSAFGFYATLIPERLLPGQFDVVGHSHQWWHFLVYASMLYWHQSGMSLLAYYHSPQGQVEYAELFRNAAIASDSSTFSSFWPGAYELSSRVSSFFDLSSIEAIFGNGFVAMNLLKNASD